MIFEITCHEHVRDGDFESLGLQESDRPYGSLQGSWEFCDGIVNLWPMRVDTDLHLLDAELAKSRGFLFADHHPVGLHLHVEQQLPRPLYDFKKVPPHENFTATKGEKKNSGIGELGQDIKDFRRRHLAMIVVIEIAMQAALVA